MYKKDLIPWLLNSGIKKGKRDALSSRFYKSGVLRPLTVLFYMELLKMGIRIPLTAKL